MFCTTPGSACTRLTCAVCTSELTDTPQRPMQSRYLPQSPMLYVAASRPRPITAAELSIRIHNYQYIVLPVLTPADGKRTKRCLMDENQRDGRHDQGMTQRAQACCCCNRMGMMMEWNTEHAHQGLSRSTSPVSSLAASATWCSASRNRT